MVGVLGAATMSLVKGPVSTMARVTDSSIVKNDMIAAVSIVSEATLGQPNADCDNDGMIEPLPFRIGLGHAPPGGGLLPAQLGMKYLDPWQREYGYCVWDHGTKKRTDNVASCGGSAANRLNGAGNAQETVIALISSGPNGLFETTCRDWADANSDGTPDQPLVETLTPSDDIVRTIPYGQFLMPSAAQARLEELPDAACTSASVGLMRIVLGVVQVCAAHGWVEIAPASGGDMSFTPVTNAIIGSSHISNTVTFGVLPAPLPVSVSGGATLSINNGAPVLSGTIQSNNTLTLRGVAANAPETSRVYAVTIGSVTKNWIITTRDAYIGRITITPEVKTAMTVTGPGSPAYGATVGFIVTNVGERPTAPLNPAILSNTVNFAFHTGGGYVGDNCAGKVLQGTVGGSQSCVIDVRPRASADTATYQGVLNVGDGMVSASANLAGSASGWSCNLPWGGQLANGSSVVAYATSCALLSCTSQVRSCTNGVLSGSFQHQTCNVLLSCL